MQCPIKINGLVVQLSTILWAVQADISKLTAESALNCRCFFLQMLFSLAFINSQQTICCFSVEYWCAETLAAAVLDCGLANTGAVDSRVKSLWNVSNDHQSFGVQCTLWAFPVRFTGPSHVVMTCCKPPVPSEDESLRTMRDQACKDSATGISTAAQQRIKD